MGATKPGAIHGNLNTKGSATPFATLSPLRGPFSRLAEHVVLGGARVLRGPEPETRRREFLHYALWAVLPARVLQGRPARRYRHGGLLFMSAYTGGLLDYLRGFTEHLAGQMDDVWGKCVAWPKAQNYAGCVKFITRYKRTSPFFYNAYGDSGVEDIRSSLRARALLDEFATLSLTAGPDAFRSAYQELAQRLWRNGERSDVE